MNIEQKRLEETVKGTPWKKWGPYLSERQWGTVREDYSKDGAAKKKILSTIFDEKLVLEKGNVVNPVFTEPM